jgi:LysR family glycine cleavage system transcriptional activator
LYDRLVADELAAGRLVRLSPVALANYGYYLAYPRGALDLPGLRAFRDWIVAEADEAAAADAG